MANIINCPLCCDKTFASKELLIEHLNNVLNNLHCPICNNKSSTIMDLIQHLTFNNCSAMNSNSVQNMSLHAITVSDNLKLTVINDSNNLGAGEQINDMFVESAVPTHDLKLVKDASGRFLLVTENSNLSNPVVTTQNSDGTISLNTVKDTNMDTTEVVKDHPLKLEEDTLISPSENDTDDTEELYSCNTCGVTFTSVLEHIQNYHTDQEVVLAEQTDENSETSSVLESYESRHPNLMPKPITDDNEVSSRSKDINDSLQNDEPRRMITEAGNIIVTPYKGEASSEEPGFVNTQFIHFDTI